MFWSFVLVICISEQTNKLTAVCDLSGVSQRHEE